MSHIIAQLLGLGRAAPARPAAVRYLSLCSGIEAASTAWHAMGWQPLAFSEIEPFPSAVLAHHWPHVPNLGDMTKWREWPEDLLAQVDVLVGGTPCQAFSVAGLRNSLSDERGNLTLIYAHLLDHLDTLRAARGLPPVICLWENVPGVLSTKDNAFGCFLGALAGEESALEPPGSKWSNAGWVLGPQRAIAWRTLDAQYFGVAQRRRRVFLVASARNDFSPEAVLFEFQGVRRDSPPSREARQVAPTIPARSLGGGGLGTDFDFDCDGGLVGSYWDGGQVSQTLDAVLAKGQTMPEKNRFPAVLVPDVAGALDTECGGGTLTHQSVMNGHLIPDTAHTLRAGGFDASEDGTGRGTPLVPVVGPLACNTGPNGHDAGNFACNQAVDSGHIIPVAYRTSGNCGAWETGDKTDALTTGTDPFNHVLAFAQNTRDEVRLQGGDGQISGALAAEPGMKQTTYVAFAIQAGAIKENPNHGPGGLGVRTDDKAYTIEARAELQAVAFIERGRENGRSLEVQEELAYAQMARNGGGATDRFQIMTPTMQVRRLTPTECERLQGFPDGHTLISWKKKPADDCPDGPRYKALGNSMAVPCMAWIGRRIQANLPTP